MADRGSGRPGAPPQGDPGRLGRTGSSQGGALGRYNSKTLEVEYRGKNVADLLGMTVDAAWEFLAEEPHVHRSLGVLRDVGLGCLRLGRPATELNADDQNTLTSWPFGYFGAMLLGLMVSSLAATEEVAVAWLPVIVLPQLLLTGVATGLSSRRDGRFESLVLMVAKANDVTRNAADWFLEAISMMTFSRPAICLLKATDGEGVSRHFAHFVDWLHLALLLLFAASGLSICFTKAEIRWKQSV
jgi:hypothetical protein